MECVRIISTFDVEWHEAWYKTRYPETMSSACKEEDIAVRRLYLKSLKAQSSGSSRYG